MTTTTRKIDDHVRCSEKINGLQREHFDEKDRKTIILDDNCFRWKLSYEDIQFEK